MRIYKMKSFKQFLDAQDSIETDPFLEMPIRIKASFFNPDSRVQVVFFQHVLLNRTQKQNSPNPNSQPSTHLHKKRANQT